MQTLFLAVQWGAENLPFEEFLVRAKIAGYDGIDTWVPADSDERRRTARLLAEYQLPVVCHQHQASGNTIRQFCRSFEYQLNLCLEWEPLLINSHSGRDYFSMDDQLKVIDTAQEFAAKHNITVAHETHRGRIAYSPYNSRDLFNARPDMRITADFSHWVCVTESYLKNCTDILHEAMRRTEHVHARVGHPQGPQVPDPRHPLWQNTTEIFVNWWREIIRIKKKQGATLLTITPEFGPPPYMPVNLSTGVQEADQFELNNFIKNHLKSN